MDDNNFTENNVVISKLKTKSFKDNFELILDNIDISFSNEIESVEPLVIAVLTFISTPNLQDITGLSNYVTLKNFLILQKEKKEVLPL